MLWKSLYRAECWNWKPTTAAGADLELSLWNIAFVAVTIISESPSKSKMYKMNMYSIYRVLNVPPESKGTE